MKKHILLTLSTVSMVVGMAHAYNLPPYEVYPYLADSTDTPPVNYMKVVEPGRTGETNASYVVLGISFPRTYQAIAGNYDGDLVIPAYIDGLPVRKINEAAFIECNKLRSVQFPATLREIGSRAFANCLSLTNVSFKSGISVMGNSVFSNCTSLIEVRFPKTLSRLGTGSFQGCLSLKDVYFEGNAPRLEVSASDKSSLGESIYRQWGYYERFKVHINRNAYGWIAPYEKGVPEKWPVDLGFMQAHETVAEDATTTPIIESGFVTVITEITGNAVAVPETWTQRYPDYQKKFGSDFPQSLLRATGKTDAYNNAMVVWQDYVAGTDPTDVTDRFVATIEIVNEKPVVSTFPELSETEKAKRKYTLYGKQRLSDTKWSILDPTATTTCNFFKVTVELK